LKQGDVVVTDGQDKLQDGSKIVPSTVPAGNSSSDATAPGATPQQNSAPQGKAARAGGKKQ